jgi:hypothetical protein
VRCGVDSWRVGANGSDCQEFDPESYVPASCGAGGTLQRRGAGSAWRASASVQSGHRDFFFTATGGARGGGVRPRAVRLGGLHGNVGAAARRLGAGGSVGATASADGGDRRFPVCVAEGQWCAAAGCTTTWWQLPAGMAPAAACGATGAGLALRRTRRAWGACQRHLEAGRRRGCSSSEWASGAPAGRARRAAFGGAGFGAAAQGAGRRAWVAERGVLRHVSAVRRLGAGGDASAAGRRRATGRRGGGRRRLAGGDTAALPARSWRQQRGSRVAAPALVRRKPWDGADLALRRPAGGRIGACRRRPHRSTVGCGHERQGGRVRGGAGDRGDGGISAPSSAGGVLPTSSTGRQPTGAASTSS